MNSPISYPISPEAAGFEQIPTLSNWRNDQNVSATIEFAKRHLDPQKLLGFLLASWFPTLEPFREKHLQAIAQMKNAHHLASSEVKS